MDYELSRFIELQVIYIGSLGEIMNICDVLILE